MLTVRRSANCRHRRFQKPANVLPATPGPAGSPARRLPALRQAHKRVRCTFSGKSKDAGNKVPQSGCLSTHVLPSRRPQASLTSFGKCTLSPVLVKSRGTGARAKPRRPLSDGAWGGGGDEPGVRAGNTPAGLRFSRVLKDELIFTNESWRCLKNSVSKVTEEGGTTGP